MCGIAGFVARSAPEAVLRPVAERMVRALAHRGPDDAGCWVDATSGVAIAHRRLAIIDPGPTGAQPAVSANGRCVLAYNGALYNAPELAADLTARGVRFRGHSDTEVLVEALAAWGVERTLARLNGMFAFALWSVDERQLTLARDRLGIKPMYWAARDGAIYFASELGALEAHGGVSLEISRASVAEYLRYGYVPAPATIYDGVSKLEPGCVLSWRGGEAPRVARYWDLADAVRKATDERLDLPMEEETSRLEALLKDAVRSQMVADVPIGCFLSGGIDSSVVTALMQECAGRPVHTFSVGFREAEFDEAAHAREVARRIGTDHNEITLDAAAAREAIPHLCEWYDEPFADSSQIPTRLIAKFARESVKVALSGDGGDELFGGYNRYFWSDTIQRALRALPHPLRRTAAAMCRALPAPTATVAGALLPRSHRPARIGEKAHKLAEILELADADEVYRRLVSQWPDPHAAMGDAAIAPVWPGGRRLDDTSADAIERMQALDAVTYLPDDILTKVDRATMSVGLEARVPLLDHRVVEFAFRLPPERKIQGKRGKLPLRRILYRRLPPDLVDRPKQGFAIPLAAWLRGPLRPWAEDLLSEARLKESGLLDARIVRTRWAEHVARTRDWSAAAWTALMLMAWLERDRGAKAAA
jgi:asparagine synthase (glutamine-hydrolysing)